MLWNLDLAAPSPLHEQLAGAVRRGVAQGSLTPGERLPAASELAGLLDVNANTVLRAYRTLRDEGVLTFRRGRGVTVSALAPDRAGLVDAARELITVGRRQGLGVADLTRLLEELS